MESIKLFKYSRTSTLILLNGIDEKIWNIQPEGYPNNIRWNAGHVYVTAEDFLKDADKDYKVTRPDWDQLFLDGTRPSEWGDDVPSKEEIIAALEEQENRIEEYFKAKLQNAASNIRDVNGTLLDTVDASLQFVTWHEGIHLGVTKSLKDALK